MMLAWADMTREQKADLVKPLYEAGQSMSTIAYRVGAPSRNSIAGIINRLRTAGKLGKGPGTGQRRKRKSVGEPDASFTAPAGRAADRSPAAVYHQEPHVEAVRDSGVIHEAGRGEGSQPRLPSRRVENKPCATAVTAGANSATVSVHSTRRQGGILGGKPSKSLQKTRAGEGAETPPILISRAAAFDPIPGVEPIGFIDLNARTCRWPVSGLYGHEHLFCGASCEFEASYCRAHAALAYQHPRERKVA